MAEFKTEPGSPEGSLPPEKPAPRPPRPRENASADVLPYNPGVEKSILSAILLDGSNINLVMSALGTVRSALDSDSKKASRNLSPAENLFFRRVANTMFRDPVNAVIYEAMLSLQANNTPIDVLSVADWLRRAQKLDQIGGEFYLLELQRFAASTVHLENWCRILKDFAMLREMMHTCSSALDLCKSNTEDVKQLLDTVETSIFNVRNNFVQPEIKELKDMVRGVFQELMDVAEGRVEPGIPTGFPDLDKLLGGGLKRGEMFVLAARPSIGKTALALNIVRNIILKDSEPRRRVAFFSLEMTDSGIVQRLLSTESRIPLTAFSDRTFQNADMIKLTTAVSTLLKTKLYIDSTAGLSIYELRAKARKLKEMEGIDLIVIDYLQLMKAGGHEESRQVEVSAISGGIKSIAKELNIPVLVLAQLNRYEQASGGKQQENPLPKLSNLRESGAIEQDADVVCFIHRDRDETKEGGIRPGGAPAKDDKAHDKYTYLIVEKNRNGRTGIVKMQFVKELMEFRCVEHKYDTADMPDKKA